MDIVEIRGQDDRRAMSQFIAVALTVYQNDLVWVPQVEEVFWQRFGAAETHKRTKMLPVIALENGSPVARGAAILASRALDETGKSQGWIGFFECMEGFQPAGAIVLQRCEQMLKEAGAESVLAPKVDNLLAGLLVRDFRLPQTVLTNHNPPYYLEIFQKCGYEVKSRILTFRFTRESVRQLDVRLPGLSTREFDRNNLTREVALFHHLQNSIFAGRNDYVPRTLEEDRDMVQSLMPLVDDELIIIAEDIEGNGVGVLICLPDVYQSFKGQQIDRARIVSIGVVPGWERKGGGALMACHLMRNLLRKGYRTAEASWILESNVPPQNLASRFNAEPGREFVLLSKRL